MTTSFEDALRIALSAAKLADPTIKAVTPEEALAYFEERLRTIPHTDLTGERCKDLVMAHLAGLPTDKLPPDFFEDMPPEAEPATRHSFMNVYQGWLYCWSSPNRGVPGRWFRWRPEALERR
jgi:hypothetical protein